MNKKTIQITAIVAIVLLVAWLGWKRTIGKEEEPKVVTAQNQTKPTVKIQVVQPEVFSEIVRLSGSLVARESVQLVAEAAGRIAYLDLQEGQRVKAGQLLLSLNNDDLKAQLAKQKAILEELETRLVRQKALLKSEAISQQAFDQIDLEFKSVSADITLIKAQIEKTEIRAPFSGRVGLRYVSKGAYVGPNTQIAELVNADPMLIDFAIPEKYASQLSMGMPLRFTVENQKMEFKAKVIAISPRIDPNTRTLQVRAQVPNPQNELVAGSFARIELSLNEIQAALMVNSTAIVPEMNTKKVFVIRNGLVEAVQVVTTARTDSRVLVDEGLLPGDTVITAGILKIRPGIQVEILENE